MSWRLIFGPGIGKNLAILRQRKVVTWLDKQKSRIPKVVGKVRLSFYQRVVVLYHWHADSTVVLQLMQSARLTCKVLLSQAVK